MAELMFNMGPKGLATFTNMLAHVSSGRYTEAALHMMSSQWATQVGKRAAGLAEMMRTGTDPV
jgi:lysozyme